MRVTEGGLGFTWSDFGSSEQRKRHVKPHPDRLGREIYQTNPSIIETRL
ncbi:heat-shock protein HtpX [Kroppenstedtia eburnea]|nr:heat-shock protein HtpX [Kroppenstedtia eburnea]